MTITEKATTTPRITAIVSLPGAGSVCSCVVVSLVVMSGKVVEMSEDVSDEVGSVVGGCVTTTPVKNSRTRYCY